jgi:lipoic acid synthetase
MQRFISRLPMAAGVRWCSATAAPAAAAAAASPAAAAKAPLSEKQSAFLNEFRQKVAAAEEASDLGSFVAAAADEKLEASGVVPLRQPLGGVSDSSVPASSIKRGRDPLPPWLKLSRPKTKEQQERFNTLKASMRGKKLATVCEEARCPNIGECWGGAASNDGEHGEHIATATIMIMGDTCTRGCRFCSIKTSRAPPPLDPAEPEKTAVAVGAMGVGYIVITMVDRDDLPDGGSAHVARTIQEVKSKTNVLLECLVGDFQGRHEHIDVVARSGLDVYAHNIECVERVTPRVRDRRASYRQTLAALERAKVAQPSLITKTSIMLGVGEAEHEILQTLKDLRTAGVDAVTLGQYLQPARSRMKVERYAHPTEFQRWKEEADAMGFLYCASGPMVRSSYRAGEFYLQNVLKKRKAEAAAATVVPPTA